MLWTTLSTKTILNNHYVTLRSNIVQLPDGSIIPDFYTITIPDASMVAAIAADGQILLKREYRYCCESEVIECPAGMFEEGETPLDVAKRELMEETGYSSDNWTYLGFTWESTAKLTNKMHLFLARDCERKASQHLDQHEQVEFFSVPLEEAVAMVMDGKINANSTSHLILKVARMMKGI